MSTQSNSIKLPDSIGVWAMNAINFSVVIFIVLQFFMSNLNALVFSVCLSISIVLSLYSTTVVSQEVVFKHRILPIPRKREILRSEIDRIEYSHAHNPSLPNSITFYTKYGKRMRAECTRQQAEKIAVILEFELSERW